MKTEVLYHFIPSIQLSRLFTELLRLEENGKHIGFTYPSASTHTCFNPEQDAELASLIESYVRQGLKYERAPYYRGNLSGEDFGISTFSQPIVQWCPVPIASAASRSIFDNEEPWGLTTGGLIVIARSMREIISREVHGLKRSGMDLSGMFDFYKIIAEGIKDAPHGNAQKSPISVDSKDIASSTDIWKYASGAILCSQRFAKFLSEFWNGLPDVKFQPVICKNISNEFKRMLMKPIVVPRGHGDLTQERHALESELGVSFPERYISFLEKHPAQLPHGWLSISGGLDSPLMRVMKSEHQDSDPAMPSNLIPIFAYGNGDYLCFQKGREKEGALRLVDWSHDRGVVKGNVDNPW